MNQVKNSAFQEIRSSDQENLVKAAAVPKKFQLFLQCSRMASALAWTQTEADAGHFNILI